MINIKHIICSLFFLAGISSFYAQDSVVSIKHEGTVSFITSQNVYLRFESTETFLLNDTIYILNGDKKRPCLILIEKSSVSCVAERIGDCDISNGDKVIYNAKGVAKESISEETTEPADSESVIDSEPIKKETDESERKQDIHGSTSFRNQFTSGNSNTFSRSIARLKLDIDNISGSKFSFSSYSNFRYNTQRNNNVSNNSNRLNIYQFAVTYDLDSSMSISLGRKYSRRMYAVGAMDGVHVDKEWKNRFVSVVMGTRPDPYNYSFNPNLFQYGISVGMYHNSSKSSLSSIGFIDQRNNGLVDRRYGVIQHRSRIGDDINVFSTAEVDMYEKNALGISSNSLSLKSLYVSANYRLSNKLRLMASFDMRKNLILYESFAQDLQNLIDNNSTRSGYRIRVNYRLSDNIYTGGGINVRRQNDGNNQFLNFNGFINLHDVLGGSLSNSVNVNRNEYFQYYTISSRYTRRFVKDKLSLSPNVRLLLYSYIDYAIQPIKQMYLGVDGYYDILDDISMGLLYDYSIRGGLGVNRFSVKIMKRF